MFLSIITPTFNSEKKIIKCAKSVLMQKFNDYEHIIIDNCSKDETINKLENLRNKKINIFSKKDKGIYHAMNKGILLSKGKYLLFLNSDDFIIDKNFFKKIHKITNKNNYDIVYSNIIYERANVIFDRKYKTGDITNRKSLGWHIPHPGTIIKKKYIQICNNYNTSYRIAADFDFFIKSQKKKNTKYFYYDVFTIKMSHGGASSGLFNVIKANLECYKSLKINEYNKPLMFIIFKLFKKFIQFF